MVRTGRIVRTIVVVMLALAGATATGQELAQAPPPMAQPASRPADREHRENLRRQIYLMEGALARAVEYGAQLLNREIRTVSPEIVALAGNAKARGVYLEGYGVFFDVSVPVLLQSQMWTFKMMFNANDPGLRDSITGMRQALKETTDPFRRRALEYAIAQLEPRGNPLAPGQSIASGSSGPAGAVGASIVNPANAAQPATSSPNPQNPAPSAPAPVSGDTKPMTIDRMWLEDPDRAYTEQIRNALVDTMLDWSTPMPIGPDEWLTVGAREDAQRDLFAPPELYDQVVTVVLRIKGSDLAAFRAGTINRDEAKRRIQTREF